MRQAADESDFYATLGLGFGGGVSLGTTYTAYTSPNNGFTTVKELMLKLAVDDSAYLGKGAVKPYVLVAQEFDAQLFVGQADGGENKGTYMELGAAPGYRQPSFDFCASESGAEPRELLRVERGNRGSA